MRIAFNPSTVAALIAPPNNKDITFDLRGHNIFARGVKFCGTDTNTWRDIKINNVSIGSNTLNLRDGDNTTLTNINGVVTINSTWRPVVDNLTSDSTTSSLSANLGRILKALIDDKSDSDHNHDDRYVKYDKVFKSTTDNANATPYLYNVENEEVISGYYKYWYIFNMGQYSKGNFGTLIAMPYQTSLTDSELFIRSANNGSWRTWRRILHSNNYTAYTVTKNGTGANGTWGISITGNANTVDSYHISDESRQVYKNHYTVDNPAGAWILIKFPAWNGYNEIVTISGHSDNRGAYCVVHCGSRNQGIWGYQSNYNGKVVDRIRWKEVDSGKFALVVLISGGITNLSIKSTSSLEISKTTEDNTAFAISSSFFSSSGVFHGNVDWDKIIGKPSSLPANGGNADTVDGYHYNDFTYKKYIGYNRNGPYNMKIFSKDISSLTWGASYLIFDIFSSGYNNRVYFGKYEVSLRHLNNTDKNPTVYSRWIFKTNSAYDCVHVIKDLSNYTVDVYIENNLWDCSMGLSIIAIDGFKMVSSNSWVNLPSASGTVLLIGTTYLSFMGNAISATKLLTARKIWGLSFDGTADVSGTLSGVAHILFSADNTYDIGSNSAASRYIYTYWLGAKSGLKLELGANNSYYGLGLCIDTNLNIGIGTNAPAYKLDIRGDIYSSATIRTAAQNQAIVLSNNSNPAWISALEGQVIFNTGKAIRFGETDWDWSQWAGLKYDHSSKTIYLGIADNNIFIANQALSGGSLRFPGISNIYATTFNGSLSGNASTATTADSANKLNKWFDSRVADLNLLFGDGSLRIFHATSSTTANKCPSDATVLHLAWDNNEGWDSLLAVDPSQNKLYFRGLNNYKWNPWQTVLHDGNSSISGNTIKINNTSLTVASSNHNHDNVYLKLAGGTMNNGARIGVNGDLYIGNADNNGYVYLQNIASLNGTDYWTISTDGSAEFEDISTRSGINVGGLIYRNGIGSIWYEGRDNALLRDTSSIGYHTLWSLKTIDGSWDFGEYNISGWSNIPMLSYITDSNYNSGNNEVTYQIKFPLASGTVALTSDIPNPTNYYWANVKVSSSPSTTTFPTFLSLATTNKILRRHRNLFFTLPFFAAYGLINLSTLTFEGNVTCTVTKITNNHFKISFDILDDIYRYLIFLTPIYDSGYVGVKYYNSDGRTLDYDLYPSSTSINTVDVMLINFRDYAK